MSELNNDASTADNTGATINSNVQEDITMIDTTTTVTEAETTNTIDTAAAAVADIVTEVTSNPLAVSVALFEPVSPVFDADYVKKILAEHEAAMKQIAEYKKKELIDKENFELRERYRKEPRAISTRNTLVLRRTPDHDKIAPTRDVLAYLELYDKKDPAKAKAEGKKVHVSDEEIKVYHDLKVQGVANITPEMVKGIIEGKGGTVDIEDDTEQDEVSTTA